MDLSLLESFYHVADEGGFAKAADRLGVSKGLVSRHIRKLEANINTQLFHRSTRVVRLTEAGEYLYLKAEEIFRLAEVAERNIEGLTQEGKGLVRFTAPIEMGTQIIKAILPIYKQQFPEVEVQLNFSSSTFNMEHGDQDIAIRSHTNISPNLVIKEIGTLKNVFVTSPSYLKKSEAINTKQDLLKADCILINRNEKWNSWLELSDNNIADMAGRVSANQYSVVRELVLSGLGIANLPFHIVIDDIKNKNLVSILDDYEVETHKLIIAHAQHRILPNKIKVFKELLVTWFYKHPEFFKTML